MINIPVNIIYTSLTDPSKQVTERLEEITTKDQCETIMRAVIKDYNRTSTVFWIGNIATPLKIISAVWEVDKLTVYRLTQIELI